MKTAQGIVLALSLTLSSALAGPKTVGVSLPLTGPGSTYGTDIKNILEFLNGRSPEAEISFVFEDDRCDAKEAVSIAQKFTSLNHLRLVTGLPCSGTVLATAPIYERAKTIAISAGAGAPTISTAGDYIFRARPSDVEASKLLARYLAGKAKIVALIAEEMDLPQGLADAFVAASGESNLTVRREGFPPNSTDLSTLLVKTQKLNPDVVLFFTQTERSSLSFVDSYRKLKLPFPLYSAVFPGSPSFLSVAKESAEGITYATLRSREFLNPEGQELLKAFEKEKGALNSVDYLFPVTVAAFRAIGKCSDAANPRECLYQSRFSGLEGEFTFDKNGDLEGMGYSLKRIEGGKPVEITF